MTALIADFGGRQFASNPAYSGATFAYPIIKGGWNGWKGNASTRHAQLERPWGDGAFPTRVLRSDRIVSCEGYVLADTHRDLLHQIEFLTAMPTDYGWLTVTEFGVTRRAWAVPNLVQCDPVSTSDLKAKFRVEWWCPEPWKYGDTRVVQTRFGGAVQVRNYGTVEASPVVTIIGPSTGSEVRMTLDGRTMRLAGGVPSGQRVAIDTASGVARDSGGKILSQRVFGELLRVPTGRAVPLTVSGAGSGSVQVSITDTYV